MAEIVVMFRHAALLMLIGAPAEAQVYRLSPTEKAAAIETASQRPDADNPALLPALPGDRRLHGEFGAMIGTGGARGVHGIVGIPLGEQGSATLAFSRTRLPGFYGYGDFDRRRVSIGASFGAGL